MSPETMISVLCLVSILLLSWAILLHTRVKVLEGEVEALKHYIQAKKKLNSAPHVEHA